MMIDKDIAYASPSTVYRVLKEAGMLQKKALLDRDHAKIIIGSYIAFYNNERLHRANAYIVPADQLAGRDNKIHEERRKKIHAARLKRKHNLLREEIKLNKLEYKLTSKKVVLLPINEPLFFGIPIEPQHFMVMHFS
jgi:hypothetical protein